LKVLQICHKFPFPPVDGGAQAIYYTSLGLLHKEIGLKILAIDTPRQGYANQELKADFYKKTRFEYATVDTGIRKFKILSNFFTTRSYFIERFYSVNFSSTLESILKAETFDIIQIEHLYLCIYLDVIKRNSKAKVVFRPQNVEHIIWERYRQNLKNPFKKLFLQIATRRLKKFETNIISQVDGIIAITRDDAGFFKARNKTNVPVISIPMGYNMGPANASIDASRQYENFPHFYHLGSMDWMPNTEAVSWFIREVYPLFANLCPNAYVHLAGRYMPEKFMRRSSEKLIIESAVKKSEEFQQDKAIMIVPLKSGSGIRAKIVEGMAMGKTIISTTTGAQGINYTPGKNIIIADSAEEFAEKMAMCARSPELCRETGSQALLLAQKDHDHVKCADDMIRFYSKILRT
jgi:polysaccharide biosynthesis protein PslH